MFRRRVKAEAREYDRERKEPVIRCSICTGEQVAGFLGKGTSHFEDVMLIRSEDDLKQFCEMYGIEGEPRRIY